MNKSLIYLDNDNIQNSIDLLEVVDQIYGVGHCETYAICINQESNSIEGKFDYIIHVNDKRIQNYDIKNLTNCMEELHSNFDFDSVIIPATYIGRMLAPRLAMRLHVGLVADVTTIGHLDENLEMVRPAFSGKIMAGIVNRGLRPVMMTVRQSVFTYVPGPIKKSKKMYHKPLNIQPSQITLLELTEKVKPQDIRESEVLISGGAGVIRNFDKLNDLADIMNGRVAASRKIIDEGIASRNIQVGQSGKTVSPKLYIALGIHGSLHHIEGLKNVDFLIAVNTNKNAPICSLADIVVEGDAVEFIEKLTKKIRESN